MLSPKAMKRVTPSALTVPSESPGVGSPSCGTAPRVSVAPVALGDVGVWAQRAAATATRAAASNRAPPGRDEPRDMPCHFTVRTSRVSPHLPWARVFPAADLRPMLAVATEVDPPLEDSRLVYEPKYDGIRAIVQVDPGPAPHVRLWSRNGNEKSRQFPELVAALSAWAASLDAPVVLDGEIVALDAKGVPAGFQRLQGRINVSVPGYRSSAPAQTPAEQPAALMIFDLLRDGDLDWRPRPLHERRAALEARVANLGSPLLRLTPQVAGDGRALHKQAEREGWEGLLVKVAASPYRAGKRTPEWRKFKIQQQDEFVVAGWTEPKGTRTQFRRAGPGGPRPRRQPDLRRRRRDRLQRRGAGPRRRAAPPAGHRQVSDSIRPPRRLPRPTGCGRSWSCRCAIRR